ncbi:MAG: D-alanyl-D-alanine carboxypeptidase [Clostridia bacterium]|nr:D-alanyl-D-alanine carboxypeptidase [Clostridia bacterium]
MRISWEDLTPRQRRRKKRAMLRQGLLVSCGLLVAVGVGLALWGLLASGEKPPMQEPATQPTAPVMAEMPTEPPTEAPTEPPHGLAADSDEAVQLGDAVGSEYALLINADTNTVIAEKGSLEAIYPASMTKVLTLLVAAESISDPTEAFTVTQALIDPHYDRGATITGYHAGDVCTLADLFYGAALRSSADATSGLAIAAGGTEEDFITMMNEKCRELGLTEQAHFTNTSGLFDSDHTCSLRDMAAIMRAAMDNELCETVMTTVKYVTAPTEDAPEGLTFENKYLRWFHEKQPEGVTVLACKNGYVQQAQNCLVSYGVNQAGEHFICVTARGRDAETMMGDQRYLYTTYGK